jgi:hypothetical protein
MPAVVAPGEADVPRVALLTPTATAAAAAALAAAFVPLVDPEYE